MCGWVWVVSLSAAKTPTERTTKEQYANGWYEKKRKEKQHKGTLRATG
jgi:hypothetical protein